MIPPLSMPILLGAFKLATPYKAGRTKTPEKMARDSYCGDEKSQEN